MENINICRENKGKSLAKILAEVKNKNKKKTRKYFRQFLFGGEYEKLNIDSGKEIDESVIDLSLVHRLYRNLVAQKLDWIDEPHETIQCTISHA